MSISLNNLTFYKKLFLKLIKFVYRHKNIIKDIYKYKVKSYFDKFFDGVSV